MQLFPKFDGERQTAQDVERRPLLIGIKLQYRNGESFKDGDRVKLKAYMDDFLRFRKDIDRATGLIAIYYLDDLPPRIVCRPL